VPPDPVATQPIPPGHAITGTVTTPAGSPVVGAVVTLLEPTGARAGVGHTDGAGSYHLVAPHEGSYLLVATALGHQPHARTVRTNGSPRTDHIALAGSASVSGTVRTAGHRRPVPMATVTAVDPVGQVIAAVTADDEGHYDLANLPPGAHTIAAHAPAHRPAAILTNLDADQRAERDLDLPPAAAIDGTVRSRTGAPVSDARVVLIAAGGEVAARALTHANGTFRFDDLCDGTYTLVASAYAPTALSATIQDGQSVGADIQLGHD
jgi:hypothetical protein